MDRQPAVAGLFYPEEPQPLRLMLRQYLNAVLSDGKAPKAIIVPHAGYIYSGAVAASAYARLKPLRKQITRVVLAGPSHRVAFSGLAVSAANAFVTPLGPVLVDTDAINALARLSFVGYLEQAHRHEHSLEVQLPFLQEMLDDFKIVPLVAGDASAEQMAEALACVWGGPETLVVVSSDLSHYHDYHAAQQLDKATTALIENLQYQQLGEGAACGRVPVSGLLKLAKDKSLAIKTVDLRNSGDTAGDKARVVGYGAYVIA